MDEQTCTCGQNSESRPSMPALPPWEPAPRKQSPPEEIGGYRLEAYGKTRYWQVTDPAGELVCIAVYKRGGREVMRRLAA